MIECPDCDSKDIATEMVHHRFPYGEETVLLSARIPVRKCTCGCEFIDHEAETLMQEAVQTYLKEG